MTEKLQAFRPNDARKVLDVADAFGKRTVSQKQPGRLLGFVLVKSISGCVARTSFSDEVPTGTAYLSWIDQDSKIFVSADQVTYYNVGVGEDSNIAAGSMLMLAREEMSNCLLANWEQCG